MSIARLVFGLDEYMANSWFKSSFCIMMSRHKGVGSDIMIVCLLRLCFEGLHNGLTECPGRGWVLACDETAIDNNLVLENRCLFKYCPSVLQRALKLERNDLVIVAGGFFFCSEPRELASVDKAFAVAQLHIQKTCRTVANGTDDAVAPINMRQFACQGLGLIYSSTFHTSSELAQGLLEPALLDYSPGGDGLFLYFTKAAQSQPKLRAFIDTCSKLRKQSRSVT